MSVGWKSKAAISFLDPSTVSAISMKFKSTQHSRVWILARNALQLWYTHFIAVPLGTRASKRNPKSSCKPDERMKELDVNFYDTLTLYISFVLGLWFWNFSNGCWLSCQTMSSEVITTVPSMAAATFLGKRLSHDTSVDERQLHSYSMRNPMFLAQVASDWYGQWKWYSATAATPGFTGCCILWLFGCVLEWMVLKWIHVPGMKWHTLWLRLWWGLIIQSASEQKQLPHWTGWKSNQNGTEDS